MVGEAPERAGVDDLRERMTMNASKMEQSTMEKRGYV
jgi:hypothetical protein